MSSQRKALDLVLEPGWVQEHEQAEARAASAGLRFEGADALLERTDPALFRSVSRRYLDLHGVHPIAVHKRRLELATTRAELDVPELLQVFHADALDAVIVTPTDFRRLRLAAALASVPKREKPKTPGAGDLLDQSIESEPQLIAIFDEILLDAIGERASDVHLEQYGETVRVRLRVDGDLHNVRHVRLSAAELKGIVNIIKVRSKLDIAQTRAPQGGRFSASAGGRNFDVRVQTQPAHHAEHVVLRLLHRESEILSVDRLGFPAALTRSFERCLDSPSGLIMVVGPTGSGKTTTLYAGLQALARDATRKVVSIEDPIELAVEGVQQTQVLPEVGFHFASAMRVFVRQDPDVILIGEIRDQETALEALRASQTGHLVLTTLHCADAVDAVQRLLDLGMHPNSIAAELLAIFGQRLARRICSECKIESTPDPALVREVFPEGLPAGFRSFRGRGCLHCSGRGTLGRVAVAEYLPSTPALRRAIASRLPLDDLRSEAHRAGLVTLRTSALTLVDRGLIALEELPSFLSAERLRPEAETSSEP